MDIPLRPSDSGTLVTRGLLGDVRSGGQRVWLRNGLNESDDYKRKCPDQCGYDRGMTEGFQGLHSASRMVAAVALTARWRPGRVTLTFSWVGWRGLLFSNS